MESVLITGAARRVGGMIAEDLAASGFFVWVHYRSHENDAFELCRKIREQGGQAAPIQADLTDMAQIDGMLENIRTSEAAELTTLINNASVILKGTLGETSADDWDRLMDTNLKAIWYLSTRFAGSFPSAKRVISIGDASTAQGFAGHAVYGLSKHALKYLTEQMAVEYAPRVRVNLLSPGLVLQGEKEPDKVWNSRVSRTLADNSGITGSVLAGIRFLMSDPGLNGSELMIDNGLHLYRKS